MTAALWSSEVLDTLDAPGTAERAQQFRDESEYTVLIHDDVYEWLFSDPTGPQRKRLRYCLRELLVSGACARRKNVEGAAKGWVRTQLGGSSGSQYYLWWAPYGYPAVDGAGLAAGEILVRRVRHHDETNQSLHPGQKKDRQLLDAAFVHDHDYSDLTTEQQDAAAVGGPPVRLIRGYPGSGKTTALLNAASNVWGPKALYITFSNRLALASAQYFRTFAPQDTSVDSLTFAELVAALSGTVAHAPFGPSFVDPALLADRLAPIRAQLGPWATRPAELYGELHAHAVGKTIPLAFRELPGVLGPLPDLDSYVAARTPAIGEPAAKAAAVALKRLATENMLPELFPELVTARSLLDRTGDPLPERFSSVSVVFVDEIQDLTVVEAMLLLSVVARAGLASGKMPQLFLAGDEAQTVRPTAFGWDWLADLIRLVFGERHALRHDVALTSSMRSPRAIALLIEATRSHYRLLEKEQRPAGLTYESPESETQGRVFYCHVPDNDGWTSVESLFQQRPSAQLVYPGARVPEPYASLLSDVAASPQVKGLDFDLVGVVAAGERQAELEALVEKAQDDRLAGALARNVADQFRVAVSRSREDLVLLDGGVESRLAKIRSLMKDAEQDPVLEVDVDRLREELEDDSNPIDRLDSQLEVIASILADDPFLALVKARNATEFLQRIPVQVDVPGPMRRECIRLHGVAAALAADQERYRGKHEAAAKLESEATIQLTSVGLADDFRVVRGVSVDLAEVDPLEWLGAVLAAAADVHASVVSDLLPLLPAFDAALARWVATVAEFGLAPDGSLDDDIRAVDSIVEVLTTRPELADLRIMALRLTAQAAEDRGDFVTALRCHEEFDPPVVADLGRSLEGLRRWREAVSLYEEAGDDVGVLRCLREIPDLERAAQLATEVDKSVVGRLRWAQALVDHLSPELTQWGAPLTEGERAFLEEVVVAGLRQATFAQPSDDARVDMPLEVRTTSTKEGMGGESPDTADQTPDEAPTDVVPEPALASASRDSIGEDLVRLEAVCADLGISLDAALSICRKLGISVVGPERTINRAQASRLRRRLVSHGVG